MAQDSPKSEAQRKLALEEERRGQVRGLLVAALGVLLLGVLRAGLPRVFTHLWWRFW